MAAAADAVTTKVPNRWFILICGCFFLNLMLGIVYSWGIFVPTLTKAAADGGYGWSTMLALLPFEIFLLVFAFMMIPAGRLQDKLGPKKLAMVGGVLMGAGYMLSALLSKFDNVGLLVCTYGLIAGAGCGLGYACAIPVARKWFPDKPALAIGIAVGGFGLSALVFSDLQKWLIKNQGVPTTFLIIGGVLLVVAVAAALILKNPPAGWKPENWQPKVTAATATAASDLDKLGIKDIIKSPRFWMLWIMFMFVAGGGLMSIGNVAKYTTSDIVPAASMTLAAWATGILAAFNAIGRPGSGFMADKMGYAKTMMIMFAIMAVSLLLIPLVVKDAWVIFLIIPFVGISFGSCFALFPTAAAENFGVKNMGRNYGLLFTAYGVGGAIGNIMAAVIKDETGKYYWAFIIASICVFVAAGVAIYFNMKAKKKASKS